MLDFLINEAAAGRILRKEAGLLLVAFGLVSVLFGQTVALAGQTRDPMPCLQPGGPGQGTARASAGMPGVETGFLPIHGSMEALEWRLALVDAAQHSIDMQYFIWRIDDTGRLLIERLLQAADRGIKVRLLLDDVLKGGLDEKWVLLNTHPNMEVRLFNPFRTRTDNWLARGPEWLFNMSRLNHRMHNKLFMVDRETAIVGGRNIGNEYFGLGSVRDFRDFDLLVSGGVVSQLEESFETFWHSDWTYVPESLTEHRADPGELEAFRSLRQEWLQDSGKLPAAFASLGRDQSDKLATVHDRLIVAPARVVYDCPPGTAAAEPLQVVEALRELPASTRDRVFIVSPYVILNEATRNIVRALRDRGVGITILTNSLEAADHDITFAAYSKRRRELLETGVEIHELKAHGKQWQDYREEVSSGEYLSMHAKLMLFDEEMVMVGSPNLDPRSKYINTEIGLLIRSKALADILMRQFRHDLSPRNSYRVQIDAAGSLYWESASGRRDTQPARSLTQRARVLFYRLLPLDHQL
jgi:putative cardiolipin synthase